jgi:TrmH family RNA methyltransferase
MSIKISSRSNQRVKDLIKNRDRYFFFEGEKLVKDILDRGIAIDILIVSATKEAESGIPGPAIVRETWVVAETVLEKLSSLKEKADFIAVLSWEAEPVDFQRAAVVIGLDGLQDPANVGTIFRCAAAFGIEAIALAGSSVNLRNPKFLRAAQNSFFDVCSQRFDNVELLIREATAAGLSIYLTSSHDSSYVIAPHHIERPCLILCGNEGTGLGKDLFERYPSVKIPQTGRVESLNVGVAACIIMYEVSLAFGMVK